MDEGSLSFVRFVTTALPIVCAIAMVAGCSLPGGVAPSDTERPTGAADAALAADAPVDESQPVSPPEIVVALANGRVCTRNRQCDTGRCVDGHCCNSACSGTCQTCITGICSPVLNGVDVGTCSGSNRCNAA